MMPNFLIARLTPSFPYLRNSRQILLGSVPHHNAFLFFNSFTSATFSDSESQRNHRKGDTFTVSYLINSCGLSPDLAVKLSQKVNLENPDKPNAVLRLLKNCGFSETQLSIFVKKRPSVLLAKPENTLLPKLEFFHSIGVSSTDLPKILIANPVLLTCSLRNYIIPRYKVLRSVVRNEEEVVAALKWQPRSFTRCGVIDHLIPNINVLRQLGVPQASISYLVSGHPCVACLEHSRFVEAAKKTEEMGFDHRKSYFVVALQVLAKTSKATWESRLEVFERWGWSRDTSLLAFQKLPNCMLMSENKIMKTMSFLVKDMGWPSEEIARTPTVLKYSLEKRIIPRCKVVKILKSKGLVKNDSSFSSPIIINEKDFLERFVTRFQENVPLLLELYQGQINHLDVIQSTNVPADGQ